MQYIIGKQIELSGASSAQDIGILFKTGDVQVVNERDQKIAAVESAIGDMVANNDVELETQTAAISQLQQQMSLMAENQALLLEKLGVTSQPSDSSSPTATPEPMQQGDAGAPAP